ncbi:YbjN domain-containing protein [Leptolyngbya sp. FACHB-17]|uniref:YbjN domain-containing protein n=1 Tax=unclassified Leptolyngbya TaxID=2650499 RepID=UPI00167FFE1A|nr:YbjN domain-containing protein [Leptolyngbya sp. FACHB-17]MBD2080955.1 YbjN domain-containing protein [Leptolyngbya sp. FACHB-17]
MPLSNGDFLLDCPIQLEATLHSNLLPQLLDHAQTEAEAIAYLQALSQQQAEQFVGENSESPLNPLLCTESWFCLSVKQQQESGETGYTTLWNYVNPALLNQPKASSEEIAEGITNFIKDWAAANLTAATQDITEDLFKGVTSLFDGFDTWLDLAIPETKSDSDDSILESTIEFFTEDDWTFTKLQGQSTLQVVCQGKNGKWNCYAQAREREEQFVFYSIYPDFAPEDKRLTIAEFLTRANYGLISGNFEMDFNDGEIRYKTSIDVEGDFLTSDLIKQLVYVNVMMMDHYFPGIQAVIEGQRSPTEAIAHIEAQSDHQ